MFDFLKNSNGEYVEGYLSSVKDFNGVVFLLREPNNKSKDDIDSPKQVTEEFWFKKVLDDFDSYHNELKLKNEPDNKITNRKRAATKYTNRFREMLISIRSDPNSLNNAIFCNVHPDYGETYCTTEYKKVMPQNAVEIFEYLTSKHPHSDLNIFTCRDIYNTLKDYLKILNEEDGLEYNKGILNMFHTLCNSHNITVYEIYHPSFSGRIINKT